MSTNVLEKVGTYKAQDVAECLIKIANEQTDLGEEPGSQKHIYEGITNLKLQKMLFFADAVSLAINDRPLIEEEFEAWNFGPVLREIYNTYKEFNSSPIKLLNAVHCDKNLEAFLIEVWKVFGKYSASELVHLSHKPNAPWHKAIENGKNTVIKKDEIKSYYRNFFQVKNA